jgi:hypothetical protein
MSEKPLNYERLKELAEQLDRPLHSMRAMNATTDPFWILPYRQELAKWFAALWTEFGFDKSTTHLRRIHYFLISQEEPVICPNGEPYENTVKLFQTLCEAARDARYLGLVPVGIIIDRRNPEPDIYLANQEDVPPAIRASGGLVGIRFEIGEPYLYKPSLDLTLPQIGQRFHIEIWCEKSTMNDVLMPLGERHKVNIITGIGEMSTTACEDLVERARESERPVRILYLSDFDPAGQSMPVAVARKIEFLVQSSLLDIQVRPIALTHEQCVQYRLPRTPLKETETRAAKFEARFGEGATELDALEAIRPGELRRILLREIERYEDKTLTRRVQRAVQKVQSEIFDIQRKVYSRHRDELEALEDRRAAMADEIEQMQERISEMETELDDESQELFDTIKEELEAAAPDVDDYEWPEPEEGDEDPDPLFHSMRTYLEQLDRYHRHQGRAAWRPTKIEVACAECGKTTTSFGTGRSRRFCSNSCRASAGRKRRSLEEAT